MQAKANTQAARVSDTAVPKGELKYAQALRDAGAGSSEVQVRGRLITPPSSKIAGPRGCIPILWCFCVHDSPDNPCPCTGPIIWFPRSSIRTSLGGSQQREETVTLTVDGSTRVFLDDTREAGGRQTDIRLLRPGEDGELEPVEESLWVQEFTPFRIDRLQRALEIIESHPQLSVMAKKKGKSFWGKLVAAFEAGWAIGTAIDEETGLSDEISDWLLDTFGPWPW